MSASILVTAKVNPDLDGVACAYAYSRLLCTQGRNAVGGIFGLMHAEAAYLVNRFDIRDVAYDPAGPFDAFVLVDASDMAGMPAVIRSEAVVEVIDHREVHKAVLFPSAEIQIEQVGAAATLIVERYRSSRSSIDPHSAVLLYGAIYSNTLNFQASITSERDRTAVDWLQSKTAIPTSLIDDMFMAKTCSASENLRDALLDAKQFTMGRYKLGMSQLEILGLRQFTDTRINEILAELERMKKEYQLDLAMLTAVDLKEGFNLFITPDSNLQAVLTKVLHVDFENSVAKKNGVLLRKQLVPLLKQAMER